jgi:hypothetical protein
MTSDLLARYGLDPRLVEWFKAADHGQCHCGKPGIYVEQRANTWLWYCPDHRPSFRAATSAASPASRSSRLPSDGSGTAKLTPMKCSDADPSGQSTHSDADPGERLRICGLPGTHMKPRKRGGRPVWRCEQHRDWPDYAVEAPDDVVAQGAARRGGAMSVALVRYMPPAAPLPRPSRSTK